MGKKEVKIYETDNLPEDKKELQKEVLRLRKEKDKKKWSHKDIKQIIIFSFLLIVLILGLLFVNYSLNFGEQNLQDNPINSTTRSSLESQYADSLNASMKNEFLNIQGETGKNGLILAVEDVKLEPTKTIIYLKVTNNNNNSVGLMAQQKSSLVDNKGNNYKIDPFDSDSSLTGRLPASASETARLAFEPLDKNASELTYTLSVLGTSDKMPWEQSVLLDIK